MKSLKSANGLTGCLIWCADGQFRIRVYDEHDSEKFADYDIKTNDLFFMIIDEDAHLYENSEGNKFIDHSPETIGIK